MKPTRKTAGEARAASEPSNDGTGRPVDGGANAPTQKDEQALQELCGCFSTSEPDNSTSDTELANWLVCSVP